MDELARRSTRSRRPPAAPGRGPARRAAARSRRCSDARASARPAAWRRSGRPRRPERAAPAATAETAARGRPATPLRGRTLATVAGTRRAAHSGDRPGSRRLARPQPRPPSTPNPPGAKRVAQVARACCVTALASRVADHVVRSGGHGRVTRRRARRRSAPGRRPYPTFMYGRRRCGTVSGPIGRHAVC